MDAEARHGAHVAADRVDEAGPRRSRASRTGRVQPFGAPSREGSEEMERCVFAMQMGRLPKPFFS